MLQVVLHLKFNILYVGIVELNSFEVGGCILMELNVLRLVGVLGKILSGISFICDSNHHKRRYCILKMYISHVIHVKLLKKLTCLPKLVGHQSKVKIYMYYARPNYLTWMVDLNFICIHWWLVLFLKDCFYVGGWSLQKKIYIVGWSGKKCFYIVGYP